MGLTKLRQDIVGPSHDILNEFYRRLDRYCENKPKSLISRFFLGVKAMPEERFYKMITVLIATSLIAEGIFLFIALY